MAAKWYLEDEEHTAQARALETQRDAGAIRVTVPDCFYYELGSLIRRAERRDRISTARADQIFGEISALPMPAVPVQPFVVRAHQLSRQHDVSIYDALYLTLAESLGAEFVTADDVLLGKVGHLPFVKGL